MGSTVLNVSVLVMMLGVAVMFRIFNRIGPVTSDKGMRRLGWAIIAIGFALALSQSERTRPVEASPKTEQPRK